MNVMSFMSGFQPIEESADWRRELFDIDQKGVVALMRVERDELRLCAATCQALRDLFLLVQRKQDVGTGAEYQRLAQG